MLNVNYISVKLIPKARTRQENPNFHHRNKKNQKKTRTMMNALQSHIRRASLLSVANRGLPSLSAPEFRLNNAILRSQCIKFNKNINNTYVNKRSITSNSWAADKLEAKGKYVIFNFTSIT